VRRKNTDDYNKTRKGESEREIILKLGKGISHKLTHVITFLSFELLDAVVQLMGATGASAPVVLPKGNTMIFLKTYIICTYNINVHHKTEIGSLCQTLCNDERL